MLGGQRKKKKGGSHGREKTPWTCRESAHRPTEGTEHKTLRTASCCEFSPSRVLEKSAWLAEDEEGDRVEN